MAMAMGVELTERQVMPCLDIIIMHALILLRSSPFPPTLSIPSCRSKKYK